MKDVLLTFSSNNPTALNESVQTIISDIANAGKCPSASAYTLQMGRRAFDYRQVLYWPDGSTLTEVAAGNQTPPTKATASPNFTVVVADQLNQLPLVGEDLFYGQSTLAKTFSEAIRYAASYFKADARAAIIQATQNGSHEHSIRQAACFTLQYAFLKVLRQFLTQLHCQGRGVGVLAYRAVYQGHSLEMAVNQLDADLQMTDDVNTAIVIDSDYRANHADQLTIKTLNQATLLKLVGDLWLRGALIDWNRLYQQRPQKISLPKYRFSKTALPYQIKPITKGAVSFEPQTIQYANADQLSEQQLSTALNDIWCAILGQDHIEKDDDFLSLGGDSLSVVHMSSVVAQKLNLTLPIDEVLSRPKFSQVISYLVGLQQQSPQVESRIKPLPASDYYMTSYAQKRMYAAQGVAPDTVAYNLGACYLVEGDIKIDRLEQTITQLIEAHASLRTSFHIVNGEVVQKIAPQVELPLEIDWLEQGATPNLEQLTQPFDLTRAPLMRAKLLRASKLQSYLFIDMHHIIGDQFSVAILLDQFKQLYRGETIQPPQLAYVDYAHWQNEQLKSKVFDASLSYWKTQLEHAPELIDNFGNGHCDQGDYRGRSLSVSFSEREFNAIKSFATEHGLTSYMLMVAAYALLINRYSERDDMILGTALAGRNREELRQVFGMFVNTLPLRLAIDVNQSAMAYFEQIKAVVLQAFKHQDIPLELIAEQLEHTSSSQRAGLFNLCINYVNMGTEELKMQGLKLSPVNNQQIDVKYDMTLTVVEAATHFDLDIEYRQAQFSDEWVSAFANQFKIALLALIDLPQQPLKALDIMTQAEKQGIQRLNDTQTTAPIHKAVIELFEAMVKARPNAAALTYRTQMLTYQTLNAMANWYADNLYRAGVAKGARVALVLDRGIEQVVAILAILKLGALYVPIDPDYPDERIAYMLSDANCKLAVVNKPYLHRITVCPAQVIDSTQYVDGSFVELKSAHTPPGLTGDHDMYIIYTSGSTGRPKGVVVPCRGVIRTVMATNYYQISAEDKTTQMINYTFDPSVMEIFGALLNGAQLFMIDKTLLLDFPSFEKYIVDVGITQTIFVTPIFHMLMDYNPKAIRTLKKVYIGGEALSPKHVKQALKVVGPGNVVNLYGPTEGSIVASFYEVQKIDDSWHHVPIGHPISGAQIYVVDKHLKLLPPGLAGELIIAGPGVAKGYLNRTELTAEKFVRLPFADNAIGYRTNDRVVLDANFVIHFIGRIDSQVKIDGYRIELDEIKARMLELPELAEVVVRANVDNNGAKYLEAYYVLTKPDETITPKQLVDQLAGRLPSYMVPARLQQLTALPLTANGKIDTKRLARIEMKTTPPVVAVQVADTPSEAADVVLNDNRAQDNLSLILNNMRRVLENDNLSATDDFFEHGGQSIKAIALSQALRDAGLEVSVNDIFARRQARAIADNIQGETQTEFKTSAGQLTLDDKMIGMVVHNLLLQAKSFSDMVTQADHTTSFTLSPIQQLHASLGNDGTGFGANFTAPDDQTVIKRVIALIKTQDMLHCIRNQATQWLLKDIDAISGVLGHSLQIADFSDYDQTTQHRLVEKLYQALIDIEYAAGEIPWRLVIARLAVGQYVAIWCFDHLVFDGMSSQILVQGLQGKLHGDGDYRAYVALLEEGPHLKDERQIRQKYQIDQWLDKNRTTMNALSQQSVNQPMVLTIETSLNNGMAGAWRQGYRIVCEVLNQHIAHDMHSALPLLLVDYGRNYRARSFFDVAGEFLDFVPFYCSEAGIEDYLAHRTKQIQADHLNFIWLMLSAAKTDQYRQLAEDLSAIRQDDILNSIIMNFQGYITSEQQDLFKSVRSEEIIPIAKLFINVFYDDQLLTVMIYSEFGFSDSQIKLYPSAEVNHLQIVEQD